MRNYIKNAGVFLLILCICLLKLIDFSKIQDIVYVTVFCCTVAGTYLVKNKYLAFCFGIALLAGASFYNISFLFLLVPVYLLIIVYKEAISKIIVFDGKNKHHSASENAYLHLLVVIGTCEGVWLLIRINNFAPEAYIKDFKGATITILLMTIMVIAGVFSKELKTTVNKLYKINSKDYSTLNLMNLTALFLIVISVVYNYVNYTELEISYSLVYFPWYVWLCVLVYEKNPMIEALFMLTKNKMDKVANKK